MASDDEDLRGRLAAALHRRRSELHLTQEAAADRCGISSRYWRDLEAGKKAGRIEIVGRMLAGLGWSWHDLADNLAPPSAALHDQAAHRLLDAALHGADGHDREVLTSILRALATAYQRRRPTAAESKATLTQRRRRSSKKSR